ncbi:MAG: hypothetical protein IJ242_11705 [Clostridia bacterium]|nr:hypothetical protein [Clostridia bacterium]
MGSMDQVLQKMQQGSVRVSCILLWVGLLYRDENMTEHQNGAMISLTDVENIRDRSQKC